MDGSSSERARTRASRREWTDEQRQAARERELQRRATAAEVRDERQRRPNGGYGIIPGFVMDDVRLSVHARFLLGMLARYAGERGYCWPSIRTMAHTLICSDRTVLRLLNELQQAGLVERKHRYLEGAQRSSIYVLRFSAWDQAVDRALNNEPPPDTGVTPPASNDEPPPDTGVTPGATPVSPRGRHGCRTEKDQGRSSTTHRENPPYPPEGGTDPAEAFGKKAGEAKGREPKRRPRSIALRSELIARVRDARRDVSIVHPMIADNAPWIAERLSAGWQLGDLGTTAEHYARELEGFGITPRSIVEYAGEKLARVDRIAEQFVAELERAYAYGDLSSTVWRERANDAMREMHGY